MSDVQVKIEAEIIETRIVSEAHLPTVKLPAVLSLPNETYRALPALNWSSLERLLQSPAHYLEYTLNPPEPTKAMELGTAIHCAILEPEIFKTRYTHCELDKRTKAFKEFSEKNSDKIILSTDEYNTITSAAKAVLSHPVVEKLVTNGKPEQTILWQHSSGLELKARPDFIGDGYLLDIKTTSDASPQAFLKSIINFGYFRQAAHYLDGANACGMKSFKFYFVAVETKAPYAIAIYELDAAALFVGAQNNESAIKRYLECKKTNHYPGYPTAIQPLSLPQWGIVNYE